MGKPIIAPSDVGMVPEFPETTAIHRYPTGDGDALLKILEARYREKCRGSELVRNRTWDLWAESHHHLFRGLLLERGIRFPDPDAAFRFGMMSELEIPFQLDVSPLEKAVDHAAAHLYFGRYAQARSVLGEVIPVFPFAAKLLKTIPAS